MNPRYRDTASISRRPQPEWVKRGWRRRSELEPGQRLMKVEAEVERLSAELGALKTAVQAVRDWSVGCDQFGEPDEKLAVLYALVPEVGA